VNSGADKKRGADENSGADEKRGADVLVGTGTTVPGLPKSVRQILRFVPEYLVQTLWQTDFATPNLTRRRIACFPALGPRKALTEIDFMKSMAILLLGR
jgi:hypothetical protein